MSETISFESSVAIKMFQMDGSRGTWIRRTDFFSKTYDRNHKNDFTRTGFIVKGQLV